VTKLLIEHPALMQRPIAVRGKRTILARPKEKILDLL
jgi:arsenate reductase-like glutaredoxin family protein